MLGDGACETPMGLTGVLCCINEATGAVIGRSKDEVLLGRAAAASALMASSTRRRRAVNTLHSPVRCTWSCFPLLTVYTHAMAVPVPRRLNGMAAVRTYRAEPAHHR